MGAWREAARRFARPPGGAEPPPHLEAVILRRGSARDFTPRPIAGDALAAVLSWASAPLAGDLPPLCSTFVVAHAVEGLDAAAYRLRAARPVGARQGARFAP